MFDGLFRREIEVTCWKVGLFCCAVLFFVRYRVITLKMRIYHQAAPYLGVVRTLCFRSLALIQIQLQCHRFVVSMVFYSEGTHDKPSTYDVVHKSIQALAVTECGICL